MDIWVKFLNRKITEIKISLKIKCFQLSKKKWPPFSKGHFNAKKVIAPSQRVKNSPWNWPCLVLWKLTTLLIFLISPWTNDANQGGGHYLHLWPRKFWVRGEPVQNWRRVPNRMDTQGLLGCQGGHWGARVWWPWSLQKEGVEILRNDPSGPRTLEWRGSTKDHVNLLVGGQRGGSPWTQVWSGECSALRPVCWTQGADIQTLCFLSFSSQEADGSRPALWHLSAAATENWDKSR